MHLIIQNFAKSEIGRVFVFLLCTIIDACTNSLQYTESLAISSSIDHCHLVVFPLMVGVTLAKERPSYIQDMKRKKITRHQILRHVLRLSTKDTQKSHYDEYQSAVKGNERGRKTLGGIQSTVTCPPLAYPGF